MDALPFIVTGLVILVFSAVAAVIGGLAILEMRRNGNRDDGPDGSVVCLGLLLSGSLSVAAIVFTMRGLA
jgi:Na+-translocating ferredoxin:NAD+ oxidoreductase RnfD subunit